MNSKLRIEVLDLVGKKLNLDRRFNPGKLDVSSFAGSCTDADTIADMIVSFLRAQEAKEIVAFRQRMDALKGGK